MILFPGSLDSFTNPVGGDLMDVVDHAGQHANANDAIEALQAKVGADSSGVNSSHDFKLSNITGSDKAVSLTGTETLTNKTLTSPVVNTPTGIVKGDVGLGSVDNTSDATKNSATATLTNKTIDGDNNTFQDIPSTAMKLPVVSNSDYTMNSTNWDNENIRLSVSGTLLWCRFSVQAKTAIGDTSVNIFQIDLDALGIGSIYGIYLAGFADGGNAIAMISVSGSTAWVTSVGYEPIDIEDNDIVQGHFVTQIATWA